jgi:hypothetical protein
MLRRPRRRPPSLLTLNHRSGNRKQLLTKLSAGDNIVWQALKLVYNTDDTQLSRWLERGARETCCFVLQPLHLNNWIAEGRVWGHNVDLYPGNSFSG